MIEKTLAANKSEEKTDEYHKLPGPKTLPIIGVGLQIKEKGCSALSELENIYGPMVKFPLPGIRGVLVNDFDLVQIILRQTERNYYKGKHYELLKPIGGNGLVTNKGASWRSRRRTLNPLFTEKAFDVEASFKSLEDDLKQKLLNQKDEDHTLIFSQTTFRILVNTFFSEMGKYNFKELYKAFHQIQVYLGDMFWSPIRLPLWFPSPSSWKTKKALKVLHTEIDRLIEASKKEKTDSFINRIRKATDPETGQTLDKKALVDELITFFIAGHDTTALTLTYTFFLLSKNKQALKKIQEEIDSLENFNYENLKTCSYLKATILESMRLMPAAYMINRNNKDWVTLGDYTFKPHTTFFTSQYAIHRSKTYWDDPEKFDPTRFLKSPNPKGFFPFGGGPRSCIGNHLAFAEALMITGSALKDLEPTDGIENFKLLAYITATPSAPVTLSWKKRKI